MNEDLSREDVTRVIDRAVEDLLATAGTASSPVDALALARSHLGLVIDPEGHRQRPNPLRPEPKAESLQWLAAHAIAVHLKPTLLERLGFDPHAKRPVSGESLTNLFAARLLVPQSWLAASVRATGCDLLALKEHYSTASHEVIAFRLLDLPGPCVITVVDNDEVFRRKNNGVRVKKKLGPAEVECQRYVSEHDEPHAVRKAGWTVQGWPVPLTGWSRVILRSVPDEE
jgi:hypothetical protein